MLVVPVTSMVGYTRVPMERRKHQRFYFGAPVKFKWRDSDHREVQGTGITRDFAVGGLFIVSNDSPALGVIVECDVDLDSSTLGSSVNIRAKGQVCRAQMPGIEGQGGGFAVSDSRMRLQRSSSAYRLTQSSS